eukprot:Stramenopile-MAST_4_protein_5661
MDDEITFAARPDRNHLEKKFVLPHIENGYVFSDNIANKSDTHWKSRASRFNRQIKCGADFVAKVQLGHKRPERCVCGKMQAECYRPACLLALCKRNAHKKKEERLEALWLNFNIVDDADLSLTEQIKLVAVDEGESVLPAVRRTQFEKLKEEKTVDRRFNAMQDRWLCGVCHALNLAEMIQCSNCGRGKGEELETDQEAYLKSLREKFVKRGKNDLTLEEKLEEKEVNRQKRRSERMKQRRQEFLAEQRRLEAEADAESYDEEAENNRIGSESDDSDEEDMVWHVGVEMTKREMREHLAQSKTEGVKIVQKSKLTELVDTINPVKYAKAGIYTFMRDELDRKTSIGKRIAYIFGTDYTDNIQETDKRKLLDGIVEWRPNLWDQDVVVGKKKMKKKKKPSSSE